MESHFNISQQDEIKMLKKLKRYKYGVFGIGVFACVLSVLLVILAIIIKLEVVVYFISAIMFGIGVAAIIEGVHYKVSLNLVEEETPNEKKKNKDKQSLQENKNNGACLITEKIKKVEPCIEKEKLDVLNAHQNNTGNNVEINNKGNKEQ